MDVYLPSDQKLTRSFNHRLGVTSMLLLLLLAFGCSTAVTARPGSDIAASGPAPLLSSGLPGLDTLDKLAQAPLRYEQGLRQSSQLIKYVQDLEPLVKSSGVSMTAGGLELLSGGGDFAWAVYSFDPQGMPLDDAYWDLDLLGSSHFACRANFSTGRWEFVALQAEDLKFSVPAEAPDYLSPAGRGYVALGSADGSLMRILDYAVNMYQGQEVKIDVAATGPSADLELLNLDGRPSIAYQDLNNGSLRFSQASSAFPALSSDWITSEVDDSLSAATALAATVHDGQPVLLYSTSGGSKLSLAWCDSSSPQADAVWQHKTITDDPLPNSFFSPQLLSVNDDLLVACYHRDSADSDTDGYKGYVEVAYPAEAQLGGDWVSYRLSTAGADACDLALNSIGGQPALAFYNQLDLSVLYWRADRSRPAPQNWEHHAIAADVSGAAIFLTELEGRPQIVASCDPPDSCAVMLADTEQPGSQTDWDIQDGAGFTPGNFTLGSFEGKVFSCSCGATVPPYYHCFMFVQIDRGPYDVNLSHLGYTAGFSQIGLSQGRICSIAGSPVAAYYESDTATSGRIRYTRVIYDF